MASVVACTGVSQKVDDTVLCREFDDSLDDLLRVRTRGFSRSAFHYASYRNGLRRCAATARDVNG